MLTIIVGRQRQTIITSDGVQAKTLKAVVRDQKKYEDLHERSDYSSADTVRIVLRSWFRLQRIPRHPGLQHAVAETLRRHHLKGHIWFDCYAFACLVHKVPVEKRHISNRWRATEQNRPQRVGDVIFILSHGRKRFRHAAVYLGRGVYLCIWGAGGDLEFMRLKDMLKVYPGAEVVPVATKKMVTAG